MRPDARLARDAAVVPDVGRAFDLVEVVEVDAFADPDVPAELDAGDRELDGPFERVVVRLSVLVEVADVLPVAVEDAAVQRPPHLEQHREELLREVVRPVSRDVAQALGIDHVDARVDRVREDLAPRRLLEEALDPSIVVHDDDPELERVRNGLETDRDGRTLLAMELDELAEVEVAERVAGDDEKRVVELVRGEPHRAGRPERRLLDRVLDVYPEALTVAEVAAN